MSRAFVKEADDRPEPPIARPIDDGHPNYVTAEGLRSLQEALERAQADGNERDATYLEARVATAMVVDPNAGPPDEVAFGSTVIVNDGRRKVRLRIVGTDEADPAHGSISWISPYAQALLGRRIGDRVIVQRPAGAATVAIEAIERA
jgi:transcription elongation GreA/GreB family factor